MNVKKILENRINVVIVPGSSYKKKLINLSKKLKKNKVCYVTVNKGAEAILDDLKKNKIDEKNFYFIDCVTKTVVNPKNKENCMFLSSPNALTELSLALNKIVDSKSIDIILVDSLSSLLVYHKSNVLLKFVIHLINKIRQGTMVLLLVSSDDEKQSELFKKLEPLVDNVLEL